MDATAGEIIKFAAGLRRDLNDAIRTTLTEGCEGARWNDETIAKLRAFSNGSLDGLKAVLETFSCFLDPPPVSERPLFSIRYVPSGSPLGARGGVILLEGEPLTAPAAIFLPNADGPLAHRWAMAHLLGRYFLHGRSHPKTRLQAFGDESEHLEAYWFALGFVLPPETLGGDATDQDVVSLAARHGLWPGLVREWTGNRTFFPSNAG